MASNRPCLSRIIPVSQVSGPGVWAVFIGAGGCVFMVGLVFGVFAHQLHKPRFLCVTVSLFLFVGFKSASGAGQFAFDLGAQFVVYFVGRFHWLFLWFVALVLLGLVLGHLRELRPLC